MNLVQDLSQHIQSIEFTEDVDLVKVSYYHHDITNYEKNDVDRMYLYIKERTGKELDKYDILHARFASSGHSDFCNTFAYELSKLVNTLQ